MRATFTFRGAEVEPHIQLARFAPLHKPTIGQQVDRIRRRLGLDDEAARDHLFAHSSSDDSLTEPGTDIPPGLWLVRDEGIYIMSNATSWSPGQPDVAYAAGYRPHDQGWFRRSAEALRSGDDFVEFLPLDPLFPDDTHRQEQGVMVAIHLTGTTIEVETVTPPG